MRLPILALLLVGCAKEDRPKEKGTVSTTPSATSTEPTFCAVNGWTERAFEEGVTGFRRRELAGDFTVETRTGTWTLSKQWSGCESYLFVPDTLTISPLDDTSLLDSRKDLKELLEKSPKNVHWFFLTDAVDRSGENAFVDEMGARVDGALDSLTEENRAWWADRLHVVTTRIDKLDGWLPDAIGSGTPGFGIDRFQRVRHIGSLADVGRPNSALQNAGYWPWDNNLAYVAHEAQYYEFEAQRQDELDQTEWTAVDVFFEEDLHSNGRTTRTVRFPDAATMAGFDSLLIDLQHVCDPADQEWGNCDAWDAVETVYICEDEDTCEHRLARYITTYHREGRWLADASQMLPYLREGGDQVLRLGGVRGGHFNTLRLLLGNRGGAEVPYALDELWTGGTWNSEYNDNHPPIEVTVPADAKRVFLKATISGHGMSSGDNCAEFCNHEHHFTVNGVPFDATHPEIGDQVGCLNQIGDGTVPNQYGTWFYMRTSWCPGKEVDPWVWEVTEQVTPGQPVTLTYTTNWADPVQDGNLYLSSQLIYWK